MNRFCLHVLLVFIGLLAGCASDSEKQIMTIEVPELARIVVSKNKHQVTGDDVELLRTRLKGLKPTRKALYDEADTHLLVFAEGQNTPDPLAVFLKDGVVYEGYFQDAWTDRMAGGKSDCFKLDRQTRELIEKLLR